MFIFLKWHIIYRDNLQYNILLISRSMSFIDFSLLNTTHQRILSKSKRKIKIKRQSQDIIFIMQALIMFNLSVCITDHWHTIKHNLAQAPQLNLLVAKFQLQCAFIY